jgi:hypothetical protein
MNEDIKKLGNYLAKKIDDAKAEILTRIDDRFKELNAALDMTGEDADDDLDAELDESEEEDTAEDDADEEDLDEEELVEEEEEEVAPKQKGKPSPAPKPPKPPVEEADEVDDFFSDAIPKPGYDGPRKVSATLPAKKAGKDEVKNDTRKEKPAKKGIFGFGKPKEEPKKQREEDWF